MNDFCLMVSFYSPPPPIPNHHPRPHTLFYYLAYPNYKSLTLGVVWVLGGLLLQQHRLIRRDARTWGSIIRFVRSAPF